MTLFLDFLGSQHLNLSYPPNKTPFVCSATVLKLSLWIDLENQYPFLLLHDFQQVSIYEPSGANPVKGLPMTFNRYLKALQATVPEILGSPSSSLSNEHYTLQV